MLSEFLWMLAGGGYIAGRAAKETVGLAAEQKYIASCGFNRERQRMLERMATSADRAERMEFERMCGYIPHGAFLFKPPQSLMV